MDDTRTAAAEAQRGRGCERTPLWYCIKVLETQDKNPVSHSSAVCTTADLSDGVVYRREETVIGDLQLRQEEKF